MTRDEALQHIDRLDKTLDEIKKALAQHKIQQGKPLTTKQITEFWKPRLAKADIIGFTRDVEAAHGIKEKNQ